MPDSIYDLTTLIDVVEGLPPSPGFLTNMFFPGTAESQTKDVAIDVIVNSRKLAPLCSPLTPARIVRGPGLRTNIIEPPYIKDKRALDPGRVLTRMPGERIGGSMSPAEREAGNLAVEMLDQINMIDRRIEWMAAQTLSYGRVVLEGEDYEPTLVDFQRDPALTGAYAGAARWGQPGVSIKDDLDRMSLLVAQKSGYGTTDLVFTASSWNAFRKDPEIRSDLDTLRGSRSEVETAGGVQIGGMPKGVWGNFRLWLYNDWFLDPKDGIEKPMLADGTVLLGSAGLRGKVACAAIRDTELGYLPMKYAPKSWPEKDPAVRMLMMQSAPITIPVNVNAGMAVKVL